MSIIEWEKKYICKNMDNAFRQVDDEIVVMDSEMSIIHRLQNESAVYTWNFINGQRTAREIIDLMQNEGKNLPNTENLSAEIADFLEELLQKKIVYLSDIPVKEEE